MSTDIHVYRFTTSTCWLLPSYSRRWQTTHSLVRPSIQPTERRSQLACQSVATGTSRTPHAHRSVHVCVTTASIAMSDGPLCLSSHVRTSCIHPGAIRSGCWHAKMDALQQGRSTQKMLDRWSLAGRRLTLGAGPLR
jgi:hypothetical protein